MITSAFSPLGSSSSSYTPQCQNFLNKPHTTTREPTTITITSYDSQQKKERENLPTPRLTLSRREAFGVGSILCSNVLFWHQAQQLVALSAEEATTTTSSKCQFKVTPSGIQFCDQVIGYGPEATKGQLIKAHYVGKLENGKVFDSSYNRGKPLTFRIGVGEVIKGWDQGILGSEGIPPMLAGGKRTLKLPPELGYGMRGAGCKGGSCIIPPDSVLLFDVEFIGKA